MAFSLFNSRLRGDFQRTSSYCVESVSWMVGPGTSEIHYGAAFRDGSDAGGEAEAGETGRQKWTVRHRNLLKLWRSIDLEHTV